MARNIICYLTVIIFALTTTKATKIMRPKFEEPQLWEDKTWVMHSLKFDKSDPHINITLDVQKEIPNADFHVELRVNQKTDPTYFIDFNSTINVCSVLNWRNQSPIGHLITTFLKEYGNLMERCPIAKGTYKFKKLFSRPKHIFQGTYFIHKFWIPEDHATGSFPEVDFELHLGAQIVEANGNRIKVIDDLIKGQGVIVDVDNVKSGFLSMLPKPGSG